MSENTETETGPSVETETVADFESILEQVQESYKDDLEPDSEDEASYEEDDSESEGEVEESEDAHDSEDEDDSEEDDSEDDYADEEDDPDEDYQTDTEEEPEQEEAPEVEQEEPQQEVSELEQMRQMLYQQQQLINQLQLDKDGPKQEAPQDAPVDPQFTKNAQQLETAFRLQLFGTPDDKEEYESLPKPVKDQAQNALRVHAQEESLNILYPERAYENKIKFFVQRDIKEAMGEIMQERRVSKAKGLFSKYDDVITTPEQKQRLLREIRSIPGHKSKDWSVQERVLDTAVDRVLREEKLTSLSERERDLELREAQIRRAQEARQTSTRGKRGRRRSRPKKEQTMKSGDDLLAFARSLEKDIRNGR